MPALPSRILMTDPRRFPDIRAHTDTACAGWGVIYRHFGASDRNEIALALAHRATIRGWLFLIAGDPDLARAVGAHGVHWPESRIDEARVWRRKNRDAVFTVSAHSPLALRRAARVKADAAFLSPVMATNSPGANQPLGIHRASSMARAARLPVFALGGMDPTQERRINNLGFSGLAMVSGASGQKA